MTIKPNSLRLAVLAVSILLPLSVAHAQTTIPAAGSNNTNVATDKSSTTNAAATPIYSSYRGVTLGMTIADVRAKLDHLKDKGDTQDFFVFSDQESAQVYYDGSGKVMAVSVNYLGKDSTPPSPEAVLGEDLKPKPDGSMYELKRYPAAGYWVSYSRTAGTDPLVSITIQKTTP